MLEEVSIAVFTLNPTLYERLAEILRGLADRVSQFSYHDRMDSLQSFAKDSSLIVLLDTSKQRDRTFLSEIGFGLAGAAK